MIPEKLRAAIKANTKHGYAGTPTYSSWTEMVRRCTNPRCINYREYGGRGIQVCERWVAFENFLADMGERPAGTTIDRIDNEGNYEPGNCRWATRSQQDSNRRDNVKVTHDGKTLTLMEWAKRYSLKYSTLQQRHSLGEHPPHLFRPADIHANRREPVRLTCQICGAEFFVRPYRANTARFCSRQCNMRWTGRWH